MERGTRIGINQNLPLQSKLAGSLGLVAAGTSLGISGLSALRNRMTKKKK